MWHNLICFQGEQPQDLQKELNYFLTSVYLHVGIILDIVCVRGHKQL